MSLYQRMEVAIDDALAGTPKGAKDTVRRANHGKVFFTEHMEKTLVGFRPPVKRSKETHGARPTPHLRALYVSDTDFQE